MDKVLELFLLIILAMGSAVLFSFVMIWKFVQAMYHLALAPFKSEAR